VSLRRLDGIVTPALRADQYKYSILFEAGRLQVMPAMLSADLDARKIRFLSAKPGASLGQA
jgi:hypothetical protein